MAIKILVHSIAIFAYAVIALKCYQRLSTLDILSHDHEEYEGLSRWQQVIYLVRNRYFLGYCLILVASTGAFFLLIGELWTITKKENSIYWSLTHLGLVIGVYLTRGFRFNFVILERFRENIYNRFIKRFLK